MINFPDAWHLAQVAKHNVHHDTMSLERRTGVLKSKYKLAANEWETLGIHTFFILTSNKSACERRLTLTVTEKEWQENTILKGNSYIDVKKLEVMNNDDLLSKLKHPGNRFSKVAVLPEHKRTQLLKLVNSLHKSRSVIPASKQSLIRNAVADTTETIAKDIIKNLGI